MNKTVITLKSKQIFRIMRLYLVDFGGRRKGAVF